MITKQIKIFGIILGGFAGLILVGFAVYVYLFYPRQADSFEIRSSNPTKKILIATQGSDFKNSLVKTLCDSLKKTSLFIKGIDVGELEKVNEKEWDKILIINSFLIRLNKDVNRFANRSVTPENILLFITSGGADWQPQPDLKIDAVTSASRKEYITDLAKLFTTWIGKEENHKWQSNDYIITLKYFPEVDVKVACETIIEEREHYKIIYPNLVNLVNQIGYQFLRLKDVESALNVFKMNVHLFPDYWNVYDSYGEALLAKGDKESAIRNYQKALELNPESSSAMTMLKKLNKE